MSKLIPVSLPENWQELSKEEQTKFLVSRLEEVGGGHGGTFIDTRTGQPQLVGIANDLHPNDVHRVLGHETGHVIDQIAGNIPTAGIEDQLLRN